MKETLDEGEIYAAAGIAPTPAPAEIRGPQTL
jgi:hypothetical protein